MERTEWDIVTKQKLIGFVISVALFFALVLCSEPGFVFIVDHANLLFHEAGHPIIGLFSERLETYGGAIGQLVFPVVLAVSFWRRGQTLSSLSKAGLAALGSPSSNGIPVYIPLALFAV